MTKMVGLVLLFLNMKSVNGRLTPGHNEEYNMIIQQMLTDGGDEKTKKDMKTLKKDIYTKGQQEVGYV